MAALTRIITLGSRGSRLARGQTETIQELLKANWPNLPCRMITLVTEGDRKLDSPLPEIGGKGLFTADLENALRSGQIDIAVHSLKDLPVEGSPDLCIGAVSERAQAGDVLISANGLTLADLPYGARVGTSSLRRQAQLKAFRPDLTVLPVRGNVDTRIRKALQGEYDAVVLAAAGIERLDLTQHVSEYIPLEIMLPAPGQGALAVQCREDDGELLELLQPIHHLATFRAVSAERAFLSRLGGGCAAPVAAYARENGDLLDIEGLVASVDGQYVIRTDASGQEPVELGQLLAERVLELGAGSLL